MRTTGRIVVTCLSCGRIVRLQRSRRKVGEAKSAAEGGRVQEDSGRAVSAIEEDAEAEEEDEG